MRGVELIGRRRAGKGALWIVGALTLPSLFGCQMIGGGQGSPGPNPRSESQTEEPAPLGGEVYQGHLDMDGGRIQAALEIRREGGRTVRCAFQGMSGLLAEGQGTLRGETLTLVLTYGGDCPGQRRLEGSWDQENKVYDGTVEASDCTGPSSGTFRFTAT